MWEEVAPRSRVAEGFILREAEEKHRSMRRTTDTEEGRLFCTLSVMTSTFALIPMLLNGTEMHIPVLDRSHDDYGDVPNTDPSIWRFTSRHFTVELFTSGKPSLYLRSLAASERKRTDCSLAQKRTFLCWTGRVRIMVRYRAQNRAIWRFTSRHFTVELFTSRKPSL